MTLMSQNSGSDDGELATKEFVRTENALTRAELHTEIADVRTEMADLRTELRTGLADVRTELRTGLADVRGEISALRTEMHVVLRRMTITLTTVLAGSLVGGMGLAAAIG
jgi:septal ring factor EnvC (AmiA/AmiB activator)